MKVRICYSSDLHLEFLSKDKIPRLLKNVGADVLILAGDICAMGLPQDYEKFIAFLDYYCPKYKYGVIHVSGNHESYVNKNPKSVTKEDTMITINKKLKDLHKKYPNYYYLDCNTLELNINGRTINFIGASLWTHVNEKDRPKIQSVMNDYYQIYVLKEDKPVRFCIDDMQKLHKKHLSFIKRSIKLAKEKNIPSILITHHVPIQQTPGEDADIYTQGYQTDITKFIEKPVKYAIFGHSHKNCNTMINGVNYLSNPKGYPNERTGFKDDLFFEI